jgi:histidyl-tRNA synthetase
MKSTIQPVKGTRDYYPEEMAVRNFLYETARKVSESFGYQEWDAPFLETIDLYAAKSGEELVKEQSFVFPDRGGDLITLRPELTPSLARLITQRQNQLVYPVRWWSWGPFWRYEKPQKGRTREFFQWNIDLIGVESREADAEIIAVAATFLRECGLSAEIVGLRVNDRKMINDELTGIGLRSELLMNTLRLIDRRDKMSPEQWKSSAYEIGLNQAHFNRLVNLLSDQELWRKSADLVKIFPIIEAMELDDYVRFDPQTIRGLDYYTNVVFEAWAKKGNFRAILGGGRYNNLVSDVGGEPMPSTGFAMGDLVITLIMKEYCPKLEAFGSKPAQVLVTLFDNESISSSFRLAAQLRQAGLKVACYPEVAKLSKQFKYGDRMGMQAATILGPDEQIEVVVAIKNLRSGEQVSVKQEEAANAIHKLLVNHNSS